LAFWRSKTLFLVLIGIKKWLQDSARVMLPYIIYRYPHYAASKQDAPSSEDLPIRVRGSTTEATLDDSPFVCGSHACNSPDTAR